MKKDFGSKINKKPLYFLAVVLIIFVAYLLIKVVQKSNPQNPTAENSLIVDKIDPDVSLPTAKPIDLVANSKSEGPLVAKMSEKTTLDDLEKAIKFLPDGESFSCSVYAGADKVEILRIDKAKGKIRSVYIDGDYVKDLVGEQSSFNWSEYFIKQAVAFSIYDSFGGEVDAISDDLTLEEQVSSLRAMLNKILNLFSNRGNKKFYPVISVSGTPPVGISTNNYVNRCVSSGGIWESFSSLAGRDLKSKVCSSLTDASVQSRLSVLNDSTSYKGSYCSCPNSQCLNLDELSERGRYDSSGYSTIFEMRGYCSGGSSIVNPPTAPSNCTSSGGIWTESSAPNRGYCTCPAGHRLIGEKCRLGGGIIGNCGIGRVNLGRMIGQGHLCFDVTTLEANCKASNGSWFDYGMGNNEVSIDSNPPSHFCGRTEKALFKQENCAYDLSQGIYSCNHTAYPSFGCYCPLNYCLNSEAKCVPDNFGNNDKEKTCTDSGGTWRQFANQYSLNSEKCGEEGSPQATLWNPMMGCDCPAGKCLSSENKCINGNDSAAACEASGGIWRDAIDAPHYSYCQCPGDAESALAPHLRTTFPRTCVQASEVDCGTDKQCFYNHVSKNTKAKLRIVEVNYFDSYRTEETSQIQTRPKSNSAFQNEIVMTVNSLKKIDEGASLKASGVVSDDTLKTCPNLINNLSQLEGKQAICTVSRLSEARTLVENGLTANNIARYGCSGELLNKIREICGGYEITVKKPAVYLYPEKSSQISVSLDINGEIVASEPKYPKGGWSVKAEPTGLIDGRYDYLFYENTLNKIEIPEEGWSVKYTDLAGWFDQNLPKIGLNDKEKNQFKEYWLNELKPANFYEIKLLSDRFLAENMQLKVDPKPDTIIRRNFIFKPVAEKTELNSPTIFVPERNGFTVIEWGGVEIE